MLDPIPQEFFDDNRERFDAESRGIDLDKLTSNRVCDHFFERKSFTSLKCKSCFFVLKDNSQLIVKDGKIVGVK